MMEISVSCIIVLYCIVVVPAKVLYLELRLLSSSKGSTQAEQKQGVQLYSSRRIQWDNPPPTSEGTKHRPKKTSLLLA